MQKQTATETLVQMSRRELDRKRLLDRILDRLLPQKDAAMEMGLSGRHVRRLLRRYKEHGAPGLVSQRRGKPSNRKLPEALKNRVLELIRNRYPDFGPTLANEKLAQVHRVEISAETLRLWMIEAKLWHGKVRRRAKPHPMRERRARFGELIQIDGSPHDWFEGRAPSCTLIIFIDDASNRVLAAVFVPVEAMEDYMKTLRHYIKKHGRPVALYADKHSIFYISDKDKLQEGELTQFGRVTKTLDIELIAAHSPQAKGRVERAFQVFQDRVIKEMRLAGVSSIEQGNAFLAKYLPLYNRRFAKVPRQPEDAHRSVQHSEQELDLIFSIHYQRILSRTSPCSSRKCSTTFKWRVSAMPCAAPRSLSAKGSTAISPCCATARRCHTRPCGSGMFTSASRTARPSTCEWIMRSNSKGESQNGSLPPIIPGSTIGSRSAEDVEKTG
ncbi:MAG: ISNCY family transposase [Anaerolineaceae bacterium]|nr:ISNCY family transposase [Anaerolineaceae bacterium]